MATSMYGFRLFSCKEQKTLSPAITNGRAFFVRAFNGYTFVTSNSAILTCRFRTTMNGMLPHHGQTTWILSAGATDSENHVARQRAGNSKRRVEVHSGLTLHDLHFVIQNVFEWENEHLYQFWVPPGGKLTRTAMRAAVRYHVTPPDPIFSDEENNDKRADEALIDESSTKITTLIVYESRLR